MVQYYVYTNINFIFYFKRSICIADKPAGCLDIILMVKAVSMLNIFFNPNNTANKVKVTKTGTVRVLYFKS